MQLYTNCVYVLFHVLKWQQHLVFVHHLYKLECLEYSNQCLHSRFGNIFYFDVF